MKKLASRQLDSNVFLPRTKGPQACSGDYGMVLISVLWVVVVIAFISLSLAAAVRAEFVTLQDSFDSEQAFLMATSAASIVFESLRNPELLGDDKVPVIKEGEVHTFPFDNGEARVHFESDSGLVDINAAEDRLLGALLDSLGLTELERNQLVDSIVDWRDPDDVPRLFGSEITDYGQVTVGSGSRRLPRNGPFESLEELLLVRYMTPEIFYGHVEFDRATKTYRRIRGLREVITLDSGGAVDVNEVPVELLAALPGMNPGLAAGIEVARNQQPFASMDDFEKRFPQLQGTETMKYLAAGNVPMDTIVAVATVRPSGATRTVRLDIGRERQKQILTIVPFIYKDVEVITFGRWRY